MFKKYLNSTLALSQASSSGSIVESYFYDAYGNRFLFQGREYDYTTQLYNFRARWYDPETGRWLSNDPIGISGGLNLYAFCGNDPVNFVDPMGLNVWVLEEVDSLFNHRVVVGERYDEVIGETMYWVADLNPRWGWLGRIVGPGKVEVINYRKFKQNPEDLREGYEIIKQIDTSPCVDEQVYEEAKRWVTEWDLYVFLGHNCYTFADYILGYAKDAQIEYNFRELIFRVDYAPTPIPFYSPRMPLN